MLDRMTEEPRRSTDATLLIDHWTRNVPVRDQGTGLVPADSREDETARILAERDARRGLHPPQATVRRVR